MKKENFLTHLRNAELIACLQIPLNSALQLIFESHYTMKHHLPNGRLVGVYSYAQRLHCTPSGTSKKNILQENTTFFDCFLVQFTFVLVHLIYYFLWLYCLSKKRTMA